MKKELLILLGIGLLALWRAKKAQAAVIPEEKKKEKENGRLRRPHILVQYPPPPPGFYIAEIIPFRRVK